VEEGGVRQKYQTNDDDALKRPGNQCLPHQNPTQKHHQHQQPPQGNRGKKDRKIIQGYVSHHRAPDLREELMLSGCLLDSFFHTNPSYLDPHDLSPKHTLNPGCTSSSSDLGFGDLIKLTQFSGGV
jgi:hypothetical protein